MSFITNELKSAALLTDRQAIVTFSATSLSTEDNIGKIKSFNQGNSQFQVKAWGKNNDLPLIRENLLSESNIAPSLIEKKRNATIGLDLFPYYEQLVKQTNDETKRIIEEVEMPPEIYDFHQANGAHKFFVQSANELVKHGNVFVEAVSDAGTYAGLSKTRRLAMMKVQQCKHIRAEQHGDDGMSPRYLFKGDSWAKKNDEKREFPIRPIEAYREGMEQDQFMYHTGDSLFSDDYYFSPAWWGSRLWIELANLIPKFHFSNLKHGYSIRYHIEIPNYLVSGFSNEPIFGEDAIKEHEARKKAKKDEILKTLDDFLAGEEKAGRAVITYFAVDQLGKIFPGIKITPMNVDLKDEALLKLMGESNRAVMSGLSVHPTLANIESAGKLSSGSEMRNALLIYLAVQTPVPRAILLEPYYLHGKISGWDPKLKFGFRDITLTTLAENPSGKQSDAVTA
jgi:hypothetical protein